MQAHAQPGRPKLGGCGNCFQKMVAVWTAAKNPPVVYSPPWLAQRRSLLLLALATTTVPSARTTSTSAIVSQASPYALLMYPKPPPAWKSESALSSAVGGLPAKRTAAACMIAQTGCLRDAHGARVTAPLLRDHQNEALPSAVQLGKVAA